MDEATRRLEREAAEGNPEALLKLVRGYLHEGKAAQALSATDDATDPAVLALRAELLLERGSVIPATAAASLAYGQDPGAVPRSLLDRLDGDLCEAFGGALGRDDAISALDLAGHLASLDRLDSARLERLEVTPASFGHPALGLLLEAQLARAPARRHDARGALPRALAVGATGAPPYADEPVPTRLFSAHGPDFKSGTFVTFDASCEDRLTYFDSALFAAIDELIDPGDETKLCMAFGRSYGLAVERGVATGLVEEAAARLNAARILPFHLVVHHHQPFDTLIGVEGEGELSPEDRRLAWRFAEDLSRHPARLCNPADTAPYARLLGSFRKGNPDPAALDGLLEECHRTYGPVGFAALERFARRAHRENERMAARRTARKEST